jgi:TolB-like protein
LVKNPSERYQSIDELLEELQKSGIVKEGSKSISFSFAKKKRSRKLIYLIAGVIIVAVLAIAFWKFFQSGPSQSEKSRFIAVLPFHPITSSEEDKSFAEGIHDDILTQLAKIRDLKVIARTSVMHYQKTQKTIKEIANELGVGVILEGSTRRVGNTVRITAQLIDAETEGHLWADSYDRPYNDIFTIQSDVAQKIASALQIKLAKEELAEIQTIPTDNMEAWEYFQRGKYFWNIYYDYQGNLKSAEMFEKACKLDTNFALAYAWQAITYLDAYFFSPSLKKDYCLKKYEKAIVKAELLAPEMPEINFARANYLINIKLDVNAAIKELELANLKRPNDVIFLFGLAEWENVRGNPEIALQYSMRVYNLDPKSPQGPFVAVKVSYRLDRYKQAERWADLLIANNPESSIGYAHKLRIYISAYGDLKRSDAVLQEAKKVVTKQKIIITLSEFVHCFYNREYNEALKINEFRTIKEEKFFHQAILLKLLNRNEEAKVYFDSLRTACLEKLESLPVEVDLYQKTIYYQKMLLAVAYAGLGNKVKAFEQISKLDSSSLSRNGLLIAYSYILLGKYEEAIHSLELSVRKPSRYILLLSPLDILPGTLKLDPVLDPLRGDPRFKRIIEIAEERFRKSEQ